MKSLRTRFFYKNQIFLSQAECSYFSLTFEARFVLNLFLFYILFEKRGEGDDIP